MTTFVCACVLAVYWGTVAVKARRLARKIGKDPNVIPREKIGRWMRIIWAPTIAAWCVQPWLIAFGVGHRTFWLRRLLKPADPAVALAALIGMLLAVVALVLTIICWRRMGLSWRIGIDPAERTELIVQGPYRLVRHPIYALSILLMLGVVLAIPTPLMLVTAGIHIIMLQIEARREETHLLKIHGSQYGRYKEAVGRFIPRFRVQ
ncbi:MAG: isoprenylcysteine carboxylmethyltransferase family protein [Phycisphaerae bacterium]|nr:isoprenylcysteine carboxylmethyltransferase family protein [Phycisphaerae bacterium]